MSLIIGYIALVLFVCMTITSFMVKGEATRHAIISAALFLIASAICFK